MTVGDEIVLMRDPERPDLTGFRGRIVEAQHTGGLDLFRIKVAGCALPGWYSAAQLAPGKPAKRRK